MNRVQLLLILSSLDGLKTDMDADLGSKFDFKTSYCYWNYLSLTHWFSMHPFSTPWKHQKTLFFWCFQGVEKERTGN